MEYDIEGWTGEAKADYIHVPDLLLVFQSSMNSSSASLGCAAHDIKPNGGCERLVPCSIQVWCGLRGSGKPA